MGNHGLRHSQSILIKGWNKMKQEPYTAGLIAYIKKVPYSKNPYKSPQENVNWSLGWVDARRRNQKPDYGYKKIKEKIQKGEL